VERNSRKNKSLDLQRKLLNRFVFKYSAFRLRRGVWYSARQHILLFHAVRISNWGPEVDDEVRKQGDRGGLNFPFWESRKAYKPSRNMVVG